MAHSGDIQRSVYELWWAVSGPHFPQSHTHSLLHRLWLQGLGDGSKGSVYRGTASLSAAQKARVVELVEQMLAKNPALQVRCGSSPGGLSCCSSPGTACIVDGVHFCMWGGGAKPTNPHVAVSAVPLPLPVPAASIGREGPPAPRHHQVGSASGGRRDPGPVRAGACLVVH